MRSDPAAWRAEELLRNLCPSGGSICEVEFRIESPIKCQVRLSCKEDKLSRKLSSSKIGNRNVKKGSPSTEKLRKDPEIGKDKRDTTTVESTTQRFRKVTEQIGQDYEAQGGGSGYGKAQTKWTGRRESPAEPETTARKVETASRPTTTSLQRDKKGRKNRLMMQGKKKKTTKNRKQSKQTNKQTINT